MATLEKLANLSIMVVKYCPIICGELSTSVIATGLVGVWRCTQLDFISTDENVLEEMAAEEQVFQPETHEFTVVEIREGWLANEKLNVVV